MEELFNSIRWSEIWPVIVVLVTAPLLLMGGGALLLSVAQYCDEKWVGFLRGVAWVTGARWRATGFTRRLIRWTIYLTWFAVIFLIAGMQQDIPPWVRITFIGVGYLLALSVGRTWVSEETRLLNGETEDPSASDQMRPMAMCSFLILLALIPMSFDVANGFQWFKGAEGYRLREWGMATIDLLLRVLIDFLELLNLKPTTVTVEYQSWPGAALVLMHFCTLAYVVVSGISLIARGDHATHSDLERLKREGRLGQLVRQRTRVVDRLVRILERPDGQTTLKGRAAAAEALGKIAEQRNRRISDAAIQALLTASRASEYALRYKATIALGNVADERARRRLLEILRRNDVMRSELTAAGVALRKFAHHPQQELQALIELGQSLGGAPAQSLEFTRKDAIARFLNQCPQLASGAWVQVALNRWIAVESDPAIKKILENILKANAAQVEKRMIQNNLDQLSHEVPAVRSRASKELAPFISDVRVPRALLDRLEIEPDQTVRFDLVTSLYQKDPRSAFWRRRIVSRLRGLLSDPISDIRASACLGLGQFPPGSPTTMKSLADLARADDEPQVQLAATISLAYLGDFHALRAYVDSVKQRAQSKTVKPIEPGSVSQELIDEIERILRELGLDGSEDGDVS